MLIEASVDIRDLYIVSRPPSPGRGVCARQRQHAFSVVFIELMQRGTPNEHKQSISMSEPTWPTNEL